MAEGDVDEAGRVGGGPADHPVLAAFGLGDLRHAVVGEDLQGEVTVPGRHEPADLLLQLVGVHLVHPLVLGRDDDVDAVGLLPDVLVDPRQLDLELFGVEPDGAEHPDPARVGDRCDHVSAVGEGEDREFDAELATDLGVHGAGPLFLSDVVASPADTGCSMPRSARSPLSASWSSTESGSMRC